MALDRENTTYKRKELKRLNDQLLVQITALQSTQGPPPLQNGPLIRRRKTTNTPKARGVTEQPPLRLQSDPTVGEICLIFIQEISTIILRKRPRSSSASKISTSLYKSKLRRQGCCITSDSEPLPLMLPTPPFLIAYCVGYLEGVNRWRANQMHKQCGIKTILQTKSTHNV